MFFGLTNSPATFQTMMNDIFKDLIDEGYVAVYMDDILVYTHMIEHHREVVTRVLDVLQSIGSTSRQRNAHLSAPRLSIWA